MSDDTDDDLTLPAVKAALPGSYADRVLVLTIAFHPETSRIGEYAVLPANQKSWALGRLVPEFTAGDEAGGRVLGLRHISRRTLEVSWKGNNLQLTKLPGTSRTRVAGRELSNCLQFSQSELERGLPIVLGHSVVLLLRLGPVPDPGCREGARHPELRGRSGHMDRLREQIDQAASGDMDVLIHGETGTGKELVARAVHQASRRASSPLVPVNMTAVPPPLAAALFFGSAKGSYTGADRAGKGYFEQAQGGSLFLDEIGDTPAELQPQLLRALQQREIQPVGRAVRRVDLRVISATDASLEGPECDFKAALRFRLGTFEIVLLPLREHPEDIGELFWYFLNNCAQEMERVNLLPDDSSDEREIGAWAELFYRLLMYHWPGNVRQLSNMAAQVVLSSEGSLVVPESVLRSLEESPVPQDSDSEAAPLRKLSDLGEGEIDRAYEQNAYEIQPTARALRVPRTSFYRWVEKSDKYRLASQVPRRELQQALSEAGGDVDEAARLLRVSATGLRDVLRHLGSDPDMEE